MYYSEVTNKPYKTEKELVEAEKQVELKKKEQETLKAKRADRAEEVRTAYEKAQKAEEEADELLRKFCDDYGSFHMTVRNPIHTINSFWDNFFDLI